MKPPSAYILRLLTRAAALAILLCLLAGCGFKDIDKRFFVVGMGIDRSGNEEKPYRITVQLAIPSPKIEPGSSKVQSEMLDAPSIAEGLRMMKAYVDKELDFGHCKMFIIGEALARSEIDSTLMWMLRRRDIQSVATVAVGKPDAQTILAVRPLSERYPGNALLLSFGSDGTESSYNYAETLSGLARRSTELGFDPALGIIANERKQSYIINQVSLFDKHRIKLVLTPEETQLFNQISDHFTKSSMHGSFKGHPLVIAINELNSRFRITRQEGQDTVIMNIRIKAVFEEAPFGTFDKDWKPLEEQLAKEYEAAAVKLLLKIRKAGVDPLGFGLRYRAMHPGEQSWTEWQRLYPDIPIQVKVKLKLEGTGLIR